MSGLDLLLFRERKREVFDNHLFYRNYVANGENCIVDSTVKHFTLRIEIIFSTRYGNAILEI